MCGKALRLLTYPPLRPQALAGCRQQGRQRGPPSRGFAKTRHYLLLSSRFTLNQVTGNRFSTRRNFFLISFYTPILAERSSGSLAHSAWESVSSRLSALRAYSTQTPCHTPRPAPLRSYLSGRKTSLRRPRHGRAPGLGPASPPKPRVAGLLPLDRRLRLHRLTRAQRTPRPLACLRLVARAPASLCSWLIGRHRRSHDGS